VTAPYAVGVIGPGRVGTALAMALPSERYAVEAVAGRGPESLARFRAGMPGAEVCTPEEAARRSDLVLLCVPDDVLVPLVRGLAAADAVRPGSAWVHTAGGHGLAALRPAQLAGARVAACHPAQTFPDPDAGRAALSGAAWAVTADPADLPWAEELVRVLGGAPVAVADANRALYHAALVLGANGTSSVVAQAREVLLGAGVSDPSALLAPLVTAAAAHAADRGAAALTGPVRRGDAGTVAANLAALRADVPEAAAAYLALARMALRQARRAGLPSALADAVEEILAEED
jgi:predicted short-subunit dehydrogenase-like oxidoreductase (DUF2520 family)